MHFVPTSTIISNDSAIQMYSSGGKRILETDKQPIERPTMTTFNEHPMDRSTMIMNKCMIEMNSPADIHWNREVNYDQK